MNKKAPRPLPVKTLKKQSTKSRRKWWPIIILAAVLIGYLVWKNYSPDTDLSPINETPAATEQDKTEPAETKLSDDSQNMLDNEDSILETNADGSTVNNNQIPDHQAILNAPLPDSDSLAKEEIDRLEDERLRLADQEKLASEQLAMNKQLTEMKAEQIALLEEQIAQLEADKGANTSKK